MAFVALSAVVICTPGPDTALTVRNALVGGRIGGVWTAAGVASGQLVWTIAAGLGAASLLGASQPAFHALKILGVVYLCYLGVQSLRTAWSSLRNPPTDSIRSPSRLGRWQAYRQGLINNLANPKMAAFFVSLLPHFIPTNAGHATALTGFLLLGALFCLLTFGWLYVYTLLIATARQLLDRPSIRSAIDTVAGCALISFGVHLAFTEQPR